MARVNAWRCDREGCKIEQVVPPIIFSGTGGNGAPIWNGTQLLSTNTKEKPPTGWVTVAMTEGGVEHEKHFCSRACAALFMYPYVPLDKRLNTAHDNSHERRDSATSSETDKWRERNAAKLAERSANK